MTRRTAIRVALAAALLTALPACTHANADKATPTATVRTEPAPTTTTNPYAVPAVIDIAYVNRVLAGLDAAVGDIVRLVVRTKTITPEALDRMKAVYADRNRLQRSIDGFQRDIRNNFIGYRPEPGNKVTIVTELVTADRSCIFVKVRRDYTAVGTSTALPVDPQWVGLKPTTSDAATQYNATGWSFVYDGFPEDLSRPPNPCAS